MLKSFFHCYDVTLIFTRFFFSCIRKINQKSKKKICPIRTRRRIIKGGEFGVELSAEVVLALQGGEEGAAI